MPPRTLPMAGTRMLLEDLAALLAGKTLAQDREQFVVYHMLEELEPAQKGFGYLTSTGDMTMVYFDQAQRDAVYAAKHFSKALGEHAGRVVLSLCQALQRHQDAVASFDPARISFASPKIKAEVDEAVQTLLRLSRSGPALPGDIAERTVN